VDDDDDDDDDDATSTFSGPSSLVTSSQCTMFRASTSHSTWQLVVSSLNIAELLRTRRVWSHSKPGSVRIQRIKSTIGYRKEIEGYIILFNALLLEHRANDTQQPLSGRQMESKSTTESSSLTNNYKAFGVCKYTITVKYWAQIVAS
jgi:hypothetical protein